MSTWSIIAICKGCNKVKRLDLIFNENDLAYNFIRTKDSVLFTSDGKFESISCNYCFEKNFELKAVSFD